MRLEAGLFAICFLVVTASANALSVPTTGEKLSSTLGRLQTLQSIVCKTAPNSQTILRQDWEQLLLPAPEFQLTREDLGQLKIDQDVRIKTARAKAIRDSKIDLNVVRTQNQVAEFCSKIPKGGMLHVHPSGTFDRNTIEGLLSTADPVLGIRQIVDGIQTANSGAMLYPNELNALNQLQEGQHFDSMAKGAQQTFEDFMFLPLGHQPFARFNAVFAFLETALVDWAGYERAVLDFSRRAVSEGVMYVEFTSGFSPEMKTMLQHVQQQTGITLRVNNSFNRTGSAAELGAQADAIIAKPQDPFVVGIDLLDNEEGNSALDKGQLLYGKVLAANLIGTSDLHRTMHAGEIGDARNPRDAMILGAERLGHGVLLNKDPVALEYASRNHIAVEVNLSSNLRLTSVTQLSEHPYLNYLRLGIPVSLSTDDEGIFEIDIKHECEVAIEQTDVTYAELKQMAFNSIETSFASDADKAILSKRLQHEFTVFESTSH